MIKQSLINGFWSMLIPVFGFSAEIVTCSFRDSQNVYREFMLKRNDRIDGTFMDADKNSSPLWKVLSDDINKIVLFREIQKSDSRDKKSVYTLFFIDKESGNFRYRNYIHSEYINTVRGDCRLK